ncbi:transcriptional regulator [Escherichia coli O55:H7 str. 3256-97]|nr:transcriptional regulator [Escherichia coli O157:H7 str. G5101]EFX24440.1 transcriptional regulator [Escherichia coli O55:H7 str. 3256-97]
MDLENKFSYHFLEGLTLTEDGILTQGNEQVYIPPKELGVLIVLLESAGHVVLKDMIIESVWKNIIVSDESLTRCIYSLRCIFEKIGYTFICLPARINFAYFTHRNVVKFCFNQRAVYAM